MPNTLADPLHPYSYTLYGLHIHSNEPLPLLAAQRQLTPALTIDFTTAVTPPKIADATLQYAYPYVNKNGESLLQIHQLTQADGLRYWVHCWTGSFWGDCLLQEDGRLLQAVAHGDVQRQDLIPLVLGTAISLAMRLQGFTCLHASAVVIDGGVVAFTGPSETGKSTTMAALLQHGAAFFSDDLVPLATAIGPTQVYPGYPRVGLWSSAMSALFGNEADLPKLAGTSKRFYTPHMLDDGTYAWPLRAVYILNPRGADPSLVQPTIVPLSQMEAVADLMPHTTGRVLRSGPDHANDLARIASLARGIAVRRIERPNDLGQLDAMAQAILDDVNQLAASSALTSLRVRG